MGNQTSTNPIDSVFLSKHRGKTVTVVEYYDDVTDQGIENDLVFFKKKFLCGGKKDGKKIILLGNFLVELRMILQ